MFTPQNMSGKARIPEALAAVMQAQQAKQKLAQAAQAGQFQPTTQTGQPTVAEQQLMDVDQLMQQMAPPQPAVQQVAQQAGMGNQIQAMQQQQAQQQAQDPQAIAQMAAQMLAQRQAQQSQMDQGIAAAPGAQAVRMAEGGIVGYAGDDESYVKEPKSEESFLDRFPKGALIHRIADFLSRAREATAQQEERGREVREGTFGTFKPPKMAEIPIPEVIINEGAAEKAAPPPKAPPSETVSRSASASVSGIPTVLPGGAADTRRQALENIERISTQPPGPEAISSAAQKVADARREYLRSQGLEPDFYEKEQQAAIQRGQERMAYADKLAADLESRRAGVGAIPQSVIDFMLGARGFKGQGLGQVMRTGAGAMAEGEAAARKEALDIKQMRFAYEDATTKERRALQGVREATAMGDWNTANANLAEAQKAQNQKYVLSAEMQGKFAHDLSQEEMKRAELKARYSELQSNKDGQRLIAAQQRVDSAMQLREKVYEKAKQFLGMTEKDLQGAPMLKTMRDNALSELARIDREVVEPAKQLRDSLQESVLGVKMPKTSAAADTGAPAPGTVMNGYKFKGGNPADKANWEKV